jgi:hypothetical protein
VSVLSAVRSARDALLERNFAAITVIPSRSAME